MARTTTKRARSYDDYLAEEFHELRRQNDGLRQDINTQNTEFRTEMNTYNSELRKEIQAIKEIINNWKNDYDRQLDHLSADKDKAMTQLGDHERRITSLELKTKKHEIEENIWSKVKKISFNALIWFFWAGIMVSAAYGVKPALKIFNLLSGM